MKTNIKAKNNKFLPQPILMEQATEALIEKLGIAKASEFWTSFSYGQKNYTEMRKKIFANETIGSLYKKVKKFKIKTYV